ncbi:hypothetical protein [Aureimonas sp. AU4]|uniref:hypothetical protein n=1 Tax=Aureimonas sp. AU4 TaxID=1638163 RepID=UPI000706320E|nr:hypothetical protein [Aureimonas sp. AU4]BAT30718.1 hypothetical protein [Aureimonas sp. AU4]
MVNAARQALDRLAAGDWEGAHALVQDDASQAAAWVHALLHRIEGDESNAAYWYRRAGRPMGTGDTEAERRAIALELGAAG